MGDVAAFPANRRAPPRIFEASRLADWHSAEPTPAATAPAVPDCRCTAGHVCRHNNACPRRPARSPSLVESRP